MRNSGHEARVASNFMALGILQGANILLPVIVMPYVIGTIGAAQYGVIAVAQALLLICVTITEYGFNQTATRFVALHKDDREKNARLFFTVLACKLLICALLLAILFPLVTLIAFFNNHATLYLLGFTWVIGQALLVSWFFQGMEKMKYITVFTLMARLLFVVLVFGFVKEPTHARYFIFYMGVGSLVAGLCSIGYALYVFKLPYIQPARKDIWFELKAGWPLMLSNIQVNTFLTVNVFILRLFTNDLAAGYYSIAEKIYLAARQVPVIFSQVIYPPLCQLIEKRDRPLNEFLRLVYYPFLALVTVACILLYMLAPAIIRLFVQHDRETPVLLLRLFSMAPLIVSLHIPASQLLLAYDKKKTYLRVLSVGTIVNLACSLVLVQFWGAIGTVIAVVTTEIFITLAFKRVMNYANQ